MFQRCRVFQIEGQAAFVKGRAAQSSMACVSCAVCVCVDADRSLAPSVFPVFPVERHFKG